MLRNFPFHCVLLVAATRLHVALAAEIVGFLTIQPLEFHNPGGRDSSGDYCDSSFFGRSSDCDHYFELSVTSKSNGALIGKISTTYYTNKNDIGFGNQFGQYQNPLRFTVYSTHNWNGEFSLSMQVYEYDDYSRDDHVDTFSNVFTNLLSDNIYRQMQIYGSRTNFIFKYRFNCEVNWYGSFCRTNCQTQPNSHYFCNNAGDKVCYAGWLDSTTNCDKPDPCYPYPCLNGGMCVRQGVTYKCFCPTPYIGINCQLNRDPCSYKNLCVNNGTCYSVGTEALCSCSKYFQGPTCAEDVNECTMDNRCSKYSTCVNLFGNYSCICPPGLTGRHCLDDIDECTTISNYCSHGGKCQNYYGTAECLCISQWQGARCNIDRNECNDWSETDGGNLACLNGGQCYNFAGGFNCSCLLNYEGRRCENHKCSNKVCYNGGLCKISSVGVAVCNCPVGFIGNDCSTNVNDCTPTPCLNGGLCTDLVNDFSCVCPIGYTGKTCKDRTDDCAGITCLHKGLCQNFPTRSANQDGFKCQCVEGYQGQFCQENVNDCFGVTCQNDGNCIDLVSDFHCLCKTGFVGRYCQNSTINCKPGICKNGVCMELLNGFECKCQNGFAGGNCQDNINDCEYGLCMHDGVCKDGINSFSCDCRYGYNGSKCENAIVNSDMTASLLLQAEDKNSNSNVKLGVPIGVAFVIMILIVVAIAYWRRQSLKAFSQSIFMRRKSDASPFHAAAISNSDYGNFDCTLANQPNVSDNSGVYEIVEEDATSQSAAETKRIKILEQNGVVNVIYDSTSSPLAPQTLEQSLYDNANFSIENAVQQLGADGNTDLSEQIYEELFSTYEQMRNVEEEFGKDGNVLASETDI